MWYILNNIFAQAYQQIIEYLRVIKYLRMLGIHHMSLQEGRLIMWAYRRADKSRELTEGHINHVSLQKGR